MKLTDVEIERARSVSIHTLLGIRNHGRRISMCCPFPDHEDGSPSFSLYPDNSYHCYGCQKHGSNAVDFTMDLTQQKFSDAVRDLLANY